MPRFVIAVLLSSAAHAGTVQGTVIDAATRQPVRKAVVTLTSAAADQSYAVAITDSSGHFLLPAIPQGQFHLSASHMGFVSVPYGATSPRRVGLVFRLASNESRASITLLLTPLSRISGTVTDPEGDGIRNIQVSLYRKQFHRSKPRFVHDFTVSTNQHGYYEFPLAVPGEYWVAAEAGFTQAVRASSISASGEQHPPENFASQTYPNPIQVIAGRDITGIDLHLTYAPQVALHGTVTGIADDVQTATVLLESEALPGDSNVLVRMPLSIAKPVFQIAGMAAGQYRVVVEAGPRRSATNVQLTAPDTELNLTLSPGPPLTGSIEVEGPGAHQIHDLRISLSPGDDQPDTNVFTRSDGNSFGFDEVAPGIWDIEITNLPPGAYIKSMHLGKQDVLFKDMVISPDTKGPLTIVVSTGAPKVQGVIEPSEPAFVLAVPILGPAQSVRTDENGHFTLTGLSPGTCRFYAFRDLEPEAWQDPKFLPPFEPQSKLLTLKEGATETLTLPLP